MEVIRILAKNPKETFRIYTIDYGNEKHIHKGFDVENHTPWVSFCLIWVKSQAPDWDRNDMKSICYVASAYFPKDSH